MAAGSTQQNVPVSAAPPPVPAPAFPGDSCDGCVRLYLPMSGENQRGDFELDLAAPLVSSDAPVGASLGFIAP
jgi:hypothetical protein